MMRISKITSRVDTGITASLVRWAPAQRLTGMRQWGCPGCGDPDP
jgi:hypothetical protein